MESSQPVQLSNILSEDYRHFESIHGEHPQEAETVFGRMDDLRTALRVFREATVGLERCKSGGSSEAIEIAADRPPLVEPDVASSAILGSAEGSIDQEIGSEIAAVLPSDAATVAVG